MIKPKNCHPSYLYIMTIIKSEQKLNTEGDFSISTAHVNILGTLYFQSRRLHFTSAQGEMDYFNKKLDLQITQEAQQMLR